MKRLAAALLLCALAPLAAAAEPEPRDQRFALRGMVTVEGNVARLRTCGDKGRDYTLVDETRSGDVTAAYRELVTGSGIPVFMELHGTVFAAPAGASIDRELRVEAVERAEKQGPGCRRMLGRIEALALGAGPAWQIEISSVGVTFASLDERGMLVFPPRSGAWPADGTLRYEGRSGAGTLALVLAPGRCRDSATANWYPMSARVVLNGAELRGCAMRGRVAPATAPSTQAPR
jgi:putative lipoprotein